MRGKIYRNSLLPLSLLLLTLVVACGGNVVTVEEVSDPVRPSSAEEVSTPVPAAAYPGEQDAQSEAVATAPQVTTEAQPVPEEPDEAPSQANQVDADQPVILLEEDFSGSSLGPEWEPVWGEWQVADGRLAPVDMLSGSKILVGAPQWQDYTVSVKLYPATEEFGGSVMVRAQDADNQFKAVFFKTENSQGTGWWRIKDSSLETIADTFIEMDLGPPPYTLTVVALGDYYAYYVNQELVSEFNDPTFRSGRVGFESWRDGDEPPDPSLSMFDDLIIYEGDARAALGLQPVQSDGSQVAQLEPTDAAPPPADVSDAEFTGSIGSFHYAVSDVTFGTERGPLSSLGTFAMVTNTGPTNPYSPVLEMQLFDDQSNLVGSGTAKILYIPSGETVPAGFYFAEGRPPFASYTIQGIDEGFVQYFEPVRVEVVPDTFQEEPCTTYTITNIDSKVATEVIVLQRYLDDQGTMIDIKSTAHRVLEPGASETNECFHNLPHTTLTAVAYHDPVNPRLDN